MTPNNLPEVKRWDMDVKGFSMHESTHGYYVRFEDYAALASRLSSPAPQVWQPMETAPRDKEQIIVLRADGGMQVVRSEHDDLWFDWRWDGYVHDRDLVGWMRPTAPVSGVAPREGEA